MGAPSTRVLSVDSKSNPIAWQNSIIDQLGQNKLAFWPFNESAGVIVRGITQAVDLIPAETSAAAEALEDDFAPIEHFGNIHSYLFANLQVQHLSGPDHADFSHGNATVDTAFSVGAWIQPLDITTVAIIAKYDSAGAKEEWKFGIDSNSKLELELHDASGSASEIGVSSASITIGHWVHVIATYDGTQTAPKVLFYIDGQLDAFDGVTTESGTYVAMENTTAPLTIGCAGISATPTEVFRGRIALPFQTGKLLTPSNTKELYRLTRKLIGQ